MSPPDRALLESARDLRFPIQEERAAELGQPARRILEPSSAGAPSAAAVDCAPAPFASVCDGWLTPRAERPALGREQAPDKSGPTLPSDSRVAG
jgi:hypothetical protein